MADGDSSGGSALNSLGAGLGKVLSYALPAALGAAMGGPLGAAAGVAEEQGGEAQYQLQEGARAMDWLKLGLEQQRIQSEEGLKKATLENTEQYRQQSLAERKSSQSDADKYRQMSLDERASEFKQRLSEIKDEHAFMNEFHNSMLLLDQQGKAIQAQLAQSTEQTRKDQLEDRRQENLRSRIAGVESLSERMAKDAMSNRTIAQHLFGDPNIQYDDAYAHAMVDGLKAQGISKEDLLNLGVSPDLVGRVYPSAKPAAAPSRAPKALWGKKGVTGPDGRKWNIDSMGRPRLAS